MLSKSKDGGARTMDRGQDLLQHATPTLFPDQKCRSCALVQSGASPTAGGTAAYVAETFNEDAVVLGDSQLAGLVVIPRRCINSLEELSPPRRARVLAAVRHATLLIRQKTEGSTSRIIAVTDSSAPAGHVSFQVLPNCADDTTIVASLSSTPL
jgi:hypothetical protein